MKKAPVALSALLSVLVAFSASAGTAADKLTDAMIDQDLIDRELAPIKSQIDMNRYIYSAEAKNSPLRQLSPNALATFMNGLTFTDEGAASFNMTPLTNNLTASQVYEVLGLFGMQSAIGTISNLRVQTESDRMIAASAKERPNAVWAAPFACYNVYQSGRYVGKACLRTSGYMCNLSVCR
ncbi:MAG: hypothetical protein LBV45_04225 [Xanthomonadaceae bacterium]|jgi:hypothetical protein|nr:hypothetical protein [Xanthomonadaceae bacterium]